MTFRANFLFVLFCVAFGYSYFLNLLLPRKQHDFAENSHFSFVYYIYVGILILKIVLSHAHKLVISDSHSLEINFFLVMSSPGGPGMMNG